MFYLKDLFCGPVKWGKPNRRKIIKPQLFCVHSISFLVSRSIIRKIICLSLGKVIPMDIQTFFIFFPVALMVNSSFIS